MLNLFPEHDLHGCKILSLVKRIKDYSQLAFSFTYRKLSFECPAATADQVNRTDIGEQIPALPGGEDEETNQSQSPVAGIPKLSQLSEQGHQTGLRGAINDLRQRPRHVSPWGTGSRS